jgi:hypothetical protein
VTNVREFINGIFGHLGHPRWMKFRTRLQRQTAVLSVTRFFTVVVCSILYLQL